MMDNRTKEFAVIWLIVIIIPMLCLPANLGSEAVRHKSTDVPGIREEVRSTFTLDDLLAIYFMVGVISTVLILGIDKSWDVEEDECGR